MLLKPDFKTWKIFRCKFDWPFVDIFPKMSVPLEIHHPASLLPSLLISWFRYLHAVVDWKHLIQVTSSKKCRKSWEKGRGVNLKEEGWKALVEDG